MVLSSFLASPVPRARAWFERWGDIVPLLLAEFILWLGFGALLPVLPIHFTEQGVVASLIAGVLAEEDIVYPFYVFAAVLTTSLIVGLEIGGRRLDGRPVTPTPDADILAASA